jgi:hypothetical protein
MVMATSRYLWLDREDRCREFGVQVTTQLRRAKLSIASAARKAGLPKQDMLRYALGLSIAHDKTLLKLAKPFGVEPAKLAPWIVEE